METIISKMETITPYQMRIILLLLKDFSTMHTITSIGKELGMTRSGIWKVLMKLKKENYITLETTGKETSLIIPRLNLRNELLEKYLNFALSKEAKEHERWIFNFTEAKEHVSFFILYGSVLKSYAKAKDLDVIGIIPDRKSFKRLHESLDKIQKSESKRIHTINFTESEFREELLKPNKAFVEAVKKGVVLFGQEGFIKFMKKLHGVSK
ncbi:HTH domain-containing protein [Candidatus Woesearchaeota archaeon]|nr:HTH domain-containing protein [Candidatus Woesearchaeota archaeon]